MSINQQFVSQLETSIQQLKDDNVYKRLNYLASPQSAYSPHARPSSSLRP